MVKVAAPNKSAPGQPSLRTGNPVASLNPLQGVAPRTPIDMRRIQALATRAASMVEQIRGRLLAPESRKISPLYSALQLAALCGVDKAHINYRYGKPSLPAIAANARRL